MPDNQMGGSPFGAPPKPEVNIRTADTDARSIGRGDAMPMPESVLPPEAGNEPVFRPETQFGEIPPGNDAMMAESLGGGGKSRLWLWIIVILAVIAVGVIGYFTYPIIFNSNSTPPPPPVVLPPPVAPPPAAAEHHTLFSAPLQDVASVTLSENTAAGVTSNLLAVATSFRTEAAARVENGVIQEIAINTAPSTPAVWSSFMPLFVPGIDSTKLATWFEGDFTSFIYYDKKGSWPGFVARIKPGVNLTEITTGLEAIKTVDLTKFYLSAPGTFGSWKTGSLNGKPTAYAKGTADEASLNYGLLGNYLVITTSFEGLKAVAPHLGL